MIDLVRKPGWRARLEAEIDAIKYVPFDWSTQHDCGFGLAGRIVYAITGEDVAAPWRGAYRSRVQALNVMRNEGVEDLADLVATLLPEIHPSRARLGDLVAYAVETPFRSALGVVNGERAFVLREDGIGTMNTLDASRAFRVG